MKNWKCYLKMCVGTFIFIALLIGLLFSSGSVKTVTFDSNGGSSIPKQYVISGELVKEPSDLVVPVGLELVGWYNNGVVWDFANDKVTDDITLVAMYKWDGVTADYSWFDNYDYETTQTFYIDNGAELYALANLVRGGVGGDSSNLSPVDFSGKTLVLTKDIDISGYEWMPIGTAENSFKGVFDGNGYEIRGLTITDSNVNLTDWDGALFGSVRGSSEEYAILKNLSVNDVDINLVNKSGYSGSAVAGFLEYVDVSNVSASGNINIETNASTVAGMFLVNEGAVTMDNVVNNVNISGTRYNANSTSLAYFILGGITGQTAGEGPFYYKNCVNNGSIDMPNPFAVDLSAYVGNYAPETIAGHIVGQASDSLKTRLVFDGCSKSQNALISGSHAYLIQSNASGYELVQSVQAVFQGKRYVDATNTVDYGYVYVSGDTNLSFRYGNETIYFVPLGTEFNLDTINTDYLVKSDTGFVKTANCFYYPEVATSASDIEAIAGGKWLISYSPGPQGIIYTY